MSCCPCLGRADSPPVVSRKLADATMEDCPLCCEPMSEADQLYPLHCPTSTCHFNFCGSCIDALQSSAADGYQEASDGSRQVKVHVQCPQCRAKYHSSKYPSSVLVPAVVLLRQAHGLATTLSTPDSELSAGALSEKHKFVMHTSLEQLQDAHRRYNEYLQEIDQSTIPALVWKDWENALPLVPRSSPKSVKTIDTSLFWGLEEFMTQEEQIFVTQLMTNGTVHGLAQASNILQGVLALTMTGKAESLSRTNPQDPVQLRKRFPLPPRMPPTVHLPYYDPAQHSHLRFQKDSLALSGVRGPAGQLGLRRGDVLTHVWGEAIDSQEAWTQELASSSEGGTLLVVFNADEETAQALHERHEKMMKAKALL